MRSPFKICLIGCGNMSRGYHAPTCAEYARLHPDTELSACCDVNPEAAKAIAEQFGFRRTYTDYLEMLRTERPNAALVIVPVALTRDVSIAVLDQKVPTVLEKPPGTAVEDTQAIHAAALRNNTPARVAFNRRYMPLVQALKAELVHCGKPIRHLASTFVRAERTDPDFSTTTVHPLDTLRFLADCDYQEARFRYQNLEYNGAPYFNVTMDALMENGATASMMVLPCGGVVMERVTVSAGDSLFLLELPMWGGVDFPGRLVCMEKGEIYKTVAGDPELPAFRRDGFYEESASFFDLLREGKDPGSDLPTGMASVAVADCIRHQVPEYRKG